MNHVGAHAKDAAGLTLAQVADMPLKDQFELVRQRTTEAQRLMTAAQNRIDRGTWVWGMKGSTPIMGNNIWAADGMDAQNSYFLEVSRFLFPENAHGSPEDLAPMLDYFREEGWPIEHLDEAGAESRSIRADTG
ncbi:MAG: hypothetical protein J0H64_06300, partial [Actinobacteria bacterium]|nr:hypothetical protein [Actinomycetota bacterium]